MNLPDQSLISVPHSFSSPLISSFLLPFCTEKSFDPALLFPKLYRKEINKISYPPKYIVQQFFKGPLLTFSICLWFGDPPGTFWRDCQKSERRGDGGWIDAPPSQLPEKPITVLIAETIFHPISTTSFFRGKIRLEAMHFALVGGRYFLPWR